MVDECCRIHVLITLDAIRSEEHVADNVQTHIAFAQRVGKRHALISKGGGIQTIFFGEVGTVPIVAVARTIVVDFADLLQSFFPSGIAGDQSNIGRVLITNLCSRGIQQRVGVLIYGVDIHHLTVFVHRTGNRGLFIELANIDRGVFDVSVDGAELCVVTEIVVDVVQERRSSFEQMQRTIAGVDGCTFFCNAIEDAVTGLCVLAVEQFDFLYTGHAFLIKAGDVVRRELVPNQILQVTRFLNGLCGTRLAQSFSAIEQLFPVLRVESTIEGSPHGETLGLIEQLCHGELGIAIVLLLHHFRTFQDGGEF